MYTSWLFLLTNSSKHSRTKILAKEKNKTLVHQSLPVSSRFVFRLSIGLVCFMLRLHVDETLFTSGQRFTPAI